MKGTCLLIVLYVTMFTFGGIIRSNVGARQQGLATSSGGGKQLPDGIVAVEYIESTGTQWIDVGLALQAGCGTILDAAYTGYTSGYCRLFGTQKAGAVGGKSCTIRTSGPNSGDIRMECYPFSGTIPFDTGRHLFFMNYPVKIYGIDAQMSFENAHWPMAVDTSSYLFGNNGATGYAAARFYRLSCIELSTGTLVRDLIPVRFVNEDDENDGGVYDLILGELYVNRGSGVFVIGGDL